jgi:hypothetical protein
MPLLKKCHLIFNIFEKDSHFKTIPYPSQDTQSSFKLYKNIVV